MRWRYTEPDLASYWWLEGGEEIVQEATGVARKGNESKLFVVEVFKQNSSTG